MNCIDRDNRFVCVYVARHHRLTAAYPHRWFVCMNVACVCVLSACVYSEASSHVYANDSIFKLDTTRMLLTS